MLEPLEITAKTISIFFPMKTSGVAPQRKFALLDQQTWIPEAIITSKQH